MTTVEELTIALAGLSLQDQPAPASRELLASAQPSLLAKAAMTMFDSGSCACELCRLYQKYSASFGEPITAVQKSLPANHPIAAILAQHRDFLRALEDLDTINAAIFKMKMLPVTSKDYTQLTNVFDEIAKIPPHMDFEEQFLFPKFEQRGLTSIIRAAKNQHLDFVQTFTGLKQLVKSFLRTDFEDFKNRLNAMTKSLVPIGTTHITMEEMILYPLALEQT